MPDEDLPEYDDEYVPIMPDGYGRSNVDDPPVLFEEVEGVDK